MRRIASMAQGYQICHCEERSDVAISQNPTGQQGSHRRNRNCLPEIAPQGHFLALRAQGATAPLGPRNDKLERPRAAECVPQRLPACKALTERRYRRNRYVLFYRCLVRATNACPRLPRPLWGLAMTNLKASRRRDACRKDCQPARRSLSAATFFSRAAALYNERRYRRNRCAPF